MAAYRLGYGVTILHDFADDPALLRDRIARADLSETGLRPDSGQLPGMTAGSETSASSRAEASAAAARALAESNRPIRDARLEAILAGLEAVGNRLAGLPGRKSLVWITDGPPIRIVTNGFPKSYEARLRETARRLATQGIAVYPVDARGLPIEPRPARGRGVVALPGSSPDQLASMDVFAEVTGGRVAKNTNDAGRGLTLAAADQRGAYSIAFHADEPDGQWHRLKVGATRPGIRLSYQQGYLARARNDDPHEWSADEWRRAAIHPLGSTGIRFTVRCELTAGVLRMILRIAPEDLHFRQAGKEPMADVELAVAEKDRGAPSIRHVPGSIPVIEGPTGGGSAAMARMEDWPLKDATQEIRVIVRDRFTGRHGTIDIGRAAIPVKAAVAGKKMAPNPIPVGTNSAP